MYLVGWLCVLTLEKWPLVAHRSPLVTRAVCCSEPYGGCCVLLMWWLTTVGSLGGVAGPWYSWLWY